MQVAARRLITICAISLIGATGGVMLGNFAAGGAGATGADELAGYAAMLDMSDAADFSPDDQTGFAARPGPTSYHCEGCDASLYKDVIEGQVAELTPLPRYEALDAPAPPQRESAPAAVPARPVPVPVAAAAAPSQIADTARALPAPSLPQ